MDRGVGLGQAGDLWGNATRGGEGRLQLSEGVRGRRRTMQALMVSRRGI